MIVQTAKPTIVLNALTVKPTVAENVLTAMPTIAVNVPTTKPTIDYSRRHTGRGVSKQQPDCLAPRRVAQHGPQFLQTGRPEPLPLPAPHVQTRQTSHGGGTVGCAVGRAVGGAFGDGAISCVTGWTFNCAVGVVFWTWLTGARAQVLVQVLHAETYIHVN